MSPPTWLYVVLFAVGSVCGMTLYYLMQCVLGGLIE